MEKDWKSLVRRQRIANPSKRYVAYPAALEGFIVVVISFLFVYYFCSLKKILSLMMIKTLDRLNGEGLEILSEKATDCKSVEAIRCISSGSGRVYCGRYLISFCLLLLQP